MSIIANLVEFLGEKVPLCLYLIGTSGHFSVNKLDNELPHLIPCRLNKLDNELPHLIPCS